MAAFHSLAYGLRLGSNLPLPGLPASPGAAAADLALYLGPIPEHARDTPAGPPDRTYPPGAPADPLLRVWRLADGRQFLFVYRNATRFLVEATGTAVWAAWEPPATLDDAAKVLLGPVLGFVLRLRGVTCLHASAVAVDGRALALVGPCGAGKSTTAAALAAAGHPLLTDDVAALERRGDGLFVWPGVPRLRLWPESVAALHGSPEALPRLTPNFDKRYRDVPAGHGFETRPRPLAAVYLLGPRRDDPTLPRVEAVGGRAALLALVTDSYTNYLLDPAMRAREFAVLGELAARVPVRRVTAHADPGRLHALCRILVEDVRAQRGPHA